MCFVFIKFYFNKLGLIFWQIFKIFIYKSFVSVFKNIKTIEIYNNSFLELLKVSYKFELELQLWDLIVTSILALQPDSCL